MLSFVFEAFRLRSDHWPPPTKANDARSPITPNELLTMVGLLELDQLEEAVAMHDAWARARRDPAT